MNSSQLKEGGSSLPREDMFFFVQGRWIPLFSWKVGSSLLREDEFFSPQEK
jgi:hypothetical protein